MSDVSTQASNSQASLSVGGISLRHLMRIDRRHTRLGVTRACPPDAGGTNVPAPSSAGGMAPPNGVRGIGKRNCPQGSEAPARAGQMWADSDCGGLDLGFIPGKNHAPPSPSPWEPPRCAEPTVSPAVLSRARQGAYAASGRGRASATSNGGAWGRSWREGFAQSSDGEFEPCLARQYGRIWALGGESVARVRA